MKIGVNTFGLGTYLHADERATWRGLLAAGITSVEPCIAFHEVQPVTEEYKAARETGIFDGVLAKEAAPAKIAELRRMGFDVYSFQLQETPFVVEELVATIPFMKQNDIHYCVYSFMHSSVDKIRAAAEAIRTAVRLFHQNDLELLVHNHDMEWHSDGGTCVMRWLLENVPELRFEIDLGWTEYAGVSSVDLLKTYPKRFPLLHIKEIARGAKAWTKAPFCTAPGEGILPLAALLNTAKSLPLDERALIIDQDDSANGDIVGDITQGVRNISRLL